MNTDERFPGSAYQHEQSEDGMSILRYLNDVRNMVIGNDDPAQIRRLLKPVVEQYRSKAALRDTVNGFAFGEQRLLFVRNLAALATINKQDDFKDGLLKVIDSYISEAAQMLGRRARLDDSQQGRFELPVHTDRTAHQAHAQREREASMATAWGRAQIAGAAERRRESSLAADGAVRNFGMASPARRMDDSRLPAKVLPVPSALLEEDSDVALMDLVPDEVDRGDEFMAGFSGSGGASSARLS